MSVARRIFNPGFTIVELLVVVVVIGILASVVIVGYNGITSRASVATMQADLENAVKALKLAEVDAGAYPATSVNIKASPGTDYQYSVDNSSSPKTFCLTATRGTTSYYITQESGKPVAGACPGHYNGGVPPPPTFASLTLTQQTAPGSQAWRDIESSADGMKIIAAGYAAVWTTADGGTTWTRRPSAEAFASTFVSATMSDDGTKIALAPSSGYIITSNDSGVTWTQNTAAGSRSWKAVAMSSDGQTIVGGDSASVFVSHDFGANWTNTITLSVSNGYNGIAVSNDGQTIFAAPYSFSSYYYYVQKSTNGGTTWSNVVTLSQAAYWAIVCSATCSTLFTGTNSQPSYYSLNSGASQTATNFGNATVRGAALSDDGTKMVTATSYIKLSKDSGATWTQYSAPGSAQWYGFSSSADGSRVGAVPSSGYIYLGVYN